MGSELYPRKKLYVLVNQDFLKIVPLLPQLSHMLFSLPKGTVQRKEVVNTYIQRERKRQRERGRETVRDSECIKMYKSKSNSFNVQMKKLKSSQFDLSKIITS